MIRKNHVHAKPSEFEIAKQENLMRDFSRFLRLPPGREYPDPSTPGLYIQVSIAGERTLWHRYYYDDCRYAECLGELCISSLKHAREFVQDESQYVQSVC